MSRHAQVMHYRRGNAYRQRGGDDTDIWPQCSVIGDGQ